MANPSHVTLRRPTLIPSQGAALRRVAIVAPAASSLCQLRGGLIGAITARRHGVMCFAPSFGEADAAALDALGATRALLLVQPPGFALFAARRSVNGLAQQLKDWRPHVVLTYGVETALMAVKAAHWAKVERIIAIVNDVAGGKPDARALRAIGRTLELADAAVFHNADDPKALCANGVLPRDLAFVVVPGAGVDLARHSVQPLPALGEGMAFLMIARLDRAKGVLDYCQAARILKARAPSAQFRLAGSEGTGAGALTARAIESYRDCVEYLGPLEDVRPALGQCHVYVYPSHAEGMPRSVLEALSAGRPVIATNVPGCRDTIDERVNGCLVPKSNPESLAAAMESFLKRPDLIPAMARASRTKAERKFDERTVNATLLEVLGLAG